MSVNFPFCPGSWMVSLCFDPNKDKCTKVEEDQCLKPELHVISKNKTNFTVVLLRVVCQISDFLFPLPPQATAGDEFQKHHFLLE